MNSGHRGLHGGGILRHRKHGEQEPSTSDVPALVLNTRKNTSSGPLVAKRLT